MKTIKYKVLGHTVETDQDGNETAVEALAEVSMPYSEENLALAQQEAYGDITVEDDGQPEPKVPASTEERITAIETKFAAMEAAYAEGVKEA